METRVYPCTYEKFVAGSVIEHLQGRTIFHNEHHLYCMLCMSRPGEPGVAHPGYLYSLLLGLTLHDLTGAVARHVEGNIKVITPVAIGDTIYAKTRVVSADEIDGKPHHGAVTVQTSGYTQNNTLFMSYVRHLVIRKSSHPKMTAC